MAEISDVVAPIVVESEDGLAVFSSVSSLRLYVEVPDVETGVYGQAFDAEGRLLSIGLPEPLFEPRPRSPFRRLLWHLLGPSFELVNVRVHETEPTHQDELKRLIASVLGMGSEAALSELLAAAKREFGVIG